MHYIAFNAIKEAESDRGIDGDKIDSILEMFYRANEISDGSGLCIFKNAIDKLKGTIIAESKPGF
ncbi:MAG: hypothetical protein WAU36_12600 [Cyclobacteriaceae bacterium]